MGGRASASEPAADGVRGRSPLGHLTVPVATGDDGLRSVLDAVEQVEGWLTAEQIGRLWEAVRALHPPATVVEIGSYRGRSAIVLALGAADGVEVVAIDPHAGNDRGPREITGTAAAGQADHDAFMANLRRAGVADRVRHVRAASPGPEALAGVDGPVDLLFIDGAHGYAAARADIERWGGRAAAAGSTMFIHDSFSSVGVTLAQLRVLFLSARWRYAGRAGSLAEYRLADLGGRARLANAGRQAAALPWFARNLVIKACIVLRLGGLTRLLGHRQATWPY
jgi:Methyltransferase domain